MPDFYYKALDRLEKVRRGDIIARNKLEAKHRLKRRGLRILSVKIKQREKVREKKDDNYKKVIGEYVVRDSSGKFQIRFASQAAVPKDVIVFTKQFATMLNSSVPMIQALGILSEQQTKMKFRKALREVQSSVENGSTLSAGLAKFPEIFDTLYIAMVEAGEASGNLDTIMAKLVTYMEKSDKIRSQVRSALTYPTLVLVVAIAVILALLTFVVPTFAEQFSESGRELPGLTQFVIDASNSAVQYWYGYLVGCIVGWFYLRYWLSTEKGRIIFDDYILSAPIVGPLMRKLAIGRFCSTMASMLSSGVNLLESLSICASSSGNRTVEDFILNVREGLERGEKFSEPLSRGDLFPDMVVSMVAVGEATGALDEMLLKVAEFYEEEVDLAVSTLMSMIEPLMIVVIGGVVGFIVIAMYLPVFEMAGNIETE
jgi:type IV pilus assembly protein PilC